MFDSETINSSSTTLDSGEPKHRNFSMRLLAPVVFMLVLASCGSGSPEDSVADAHNEVLDQVDAIVNDDAGVESLVAHLAPECREDFVQSIATSAAFGIDFEALLAAMLVGQELDDLKASAADVEITGESSARVTTQATGEVEEYVLVNGTWYSGC